MLIQNIDLDTKSLLIFVHHITNTQYTGQIYGLR